MPYSFYHQIKRMAAFDCLSYIYNMKVIYTAFVLWLIAVSCVNDKSERAVITDSGLYEISKNEAGFQYFKMNPDTLSAHRESPHGSNVRIRFNNIAVSAMNDSISDIRGDRFPDGSLIVKEIYDFPGDDLNLLSIMYKSSNDPAAGAGWLWNEVGPNGEVIYPVARKGDGCTGCHSAPGNRDFIRTFSLH